MLHVNCTIQNQTCTYKDPLALFPAAVGGIGVLRHRGEREAEEGEGKREKERGKMKEKRRRGRRQEGKGKEIGGKRIFIEDAYNEGRKGNRKGKEEGKRENLFSK